jgi:hypothetical protein
LPEAPYGMRSRSPCPGWSPGPASSSSAFWCPRGWKGGGGYVEATRQIHRLFCIENLPDYSQLKYSLFLTAIVTGTR